MQIRFKAMVLLDKNMRVTSENLRVYPTVPAKR